MQEAKSSQYQERGFDTDQIRHSISVPDYLRARGAEIRGSGGNLKMLCPFHEEKTPSFVIWDDHFHCYGCSAHGDVITLDQRLSQRSFQESCLALGGHEPQGDSGASSISRVKDQTRQQEAARAKRLQLKCRRCREKILEKYSWPFEEVWSQSPVLHKSMKWPEQWRYFLRNVFPEDAIVWIGELWESGSLSYRSNFRPVKDWLQCEKLPGSRICPAVFLAGVFARSTKSIEATPLIVVEADEAIGKKPETVEEVNANRHANLAIIRWLKDGVGMNLRAIIDSGNKSLHGWFDNPGPSVIGDLSKIAGELGIDGLITKPAQPLRMPYVKHSAGNRYSNLIWLA